MILAVQFEPLSLAIHAEPFFMTDDPVAITLQVTKVLESFGIPYFIGGSFASSLFGNGNAARDVDIIASLEAEHLPLFVEVVGGEFDLQLEQAARAVAERTSFRLTHRETGFNVDIFVPPQNRFLRMQFSRSRKEKIGPDSQAIAFVASPEDTILAKLAWYRRGGEGSERQWDDVIGILEARGDTLNDAYLQLMADELLIRDLLDRALQSIP